LADSVGIPLEWAEQVLIGGSFGKYINVEKAILIGLLPDLPWERFQFFGSTAVRGLPFPAGPAGSPAGSKLLPA
jgi:uncharacterized 2Fe-2S/4Fe-4S cluster protein (DUF4445 family)